MTPTQPAPLRLDDLKPRSIFDDMTLDELRLLELGQHAWGNSRTRARRGALYLDRVMPDWYGRVRLRELNLGDACRCVLGQIFDDAHSELMKTLVPTDFTDDALDSGFALGFEALFSTDDSLPPIHASVMFGFDYGDGDNYACRTRDWKALTAAWTREIKIRAAAS